MKLLALVILMLGIGISSPGHAVLPDEVLQDPALEARARELSKDLRCLVCQNQSIDDSNAPLARDLRVLVRERLLAGDSDDDIRYFIVERYGDYVLLTPPFNASTFLLWVGPGLIFIGGMTIAFFSFRRHGRAEPVAGISNPEEQKRINTLLNDDKDPLS